MRKFHWSLNLLVSLVLSLSVLSSGLMLYEYFHLKSLDGNSEYPFGCEEAIAIGGASYESREAYLESTMVGGFVFAGIAVVLALGIFSKHKWLAVVGTFLWLGYLWLQATGAP